MDIPLETVSDFLAGSAGLCVGTTPLPPVSRPAPFVRSAFPVDAHETGMKKMPSPLLSTYPVLGATEMMFVGRGNMEMVMELLDTVDGLGKRSSQGLGEIDKERTQLFPIRDAFFPLRWPNGQPTRHMPWTQFVESANDDVALRSVCRGKTPYRVPYWQSGHDDTEVAVATNGYMPREAFMTWLRESA
ncbi:hypothetical protein [Acidithiobacillus ferrooxidans]|uniref:hypothetical protein n=1 Tax=Acidithiobacillus ferrooxidans TaxID=920 RepID=UPI0013D4FA69|nr:hypothetical protein [Acidithiobacillus ferrooxidans]